MRVKLTVENVEELFLIDTGFSGDLIVKSDVFDEISAKPSDGGEICVAKDLCFSALQKVVSVNILGKQILCRALWVPEIEENIIGEGVLIKAGLLLDYKNFAISDP